jgi:hypothetical protein
VRWFIGVAEGGGSTRERAHHRWEKANTILGDPDAVRALKPPFDMKGQVRLEVILNGQ